MTAPTNSVLDRLDRSDVARLIAQHRYWGGPLAGLLNVEARADLFRRRAVVECLPEAPDVYGWRAPRRGAGTERARLGKVCP